MTPVSRSTFSPGPPRARRTRRVAIVGGGIAGLTLAAALDPRHFETTVFEAAPERAGIGSSLGLWPTAQRGLAALVETDEPRRTDSTALRRLFAGGAQPVGGALRHISGRALVSATVPGLRMVDRPALRAAVPATVRVLDERVADPSHLEADVVVGADGVRSVVRGMVDPAASARRETPFVALRGRLHLPPDPRDVGEYWGGGLLFGLVPVADHAYWFTSHRSRQGPEPLDPRSVAREAAARATGAAQIVQTTLASVDESTLATRLWVTPPLHRYTRGRYVVIGDAAHAMTPNLGRGANDAILDALTLARALTAATARADAGSRIGGDWVRRLWLARRVPRTQLARLASGALMRAALSLPG